MEKEQNHIFGKKDQIDQKYSVQFFIKKGSHAETYRVKDKDGTTFFLKLFNYAKLHKGQFDSENRITEIEFLKNIQHPNIVSYHDNGEVITGKQKFGYLILDFISGETLAQRMQRENNFSVYKAQNIISGVLKGLSYLHNLEDPIIHNEITNQNVMLDLSRKNGVPAIIDFGYARSFTQSAKAFNKQGLNPFYLAPECFNSIFSPQSDLFSVGALFYHMLTGLPPWHTQISDYKTSRENIEEIILKEREKPLSFTTLSGQTVNGIGEDIKDIIQKALSANVDQRFSTAKEFIGALKGDLDVGELKAKKSDTGQRKVFSKKEFSANESGEGFDKIAGMESLKETIYNDVIRALEEKELYEEYGLTIPNGMLLYGPPGCGKTFFAQQLAEEVGFHFASIKPSDLASIYVHGAQEKIGELFNQARENAPAIIFFDELDALVPSRDGNLNHSYSEGVNEFLAQMTNCSKDGIFVIGATNRPDKIDPAILRTGRIDKMFNIPPPDFDARKALFKLYLEERPVELGIDYEKLAELTENYVSSDIEFLVNEAARKALQNKGKITQEIIEVTIKDNSPSINTTELKKYEAIGSKMKGGQLKGKDSSTIGF
ncbi:MAG: protein kinase domain-containing protein [Bacteroidota bacterium]